MSTTGSRTDAQPGRTAEARTGTQLPAVPTSAPDWRLVEEGFDLAREHEVESLFAISNGYLGARAALGERGPLSSPALFIAGVFDGGSEPGSIPELVAVPDVFSLRVAIDGRELRLERGVMLEHRRILDLRQGLLWREWRQRDPSGRIVRLRSLRLASLADRHVLFRSVEFTPENFYGRLHVQGWFEPLAGESAAPWALVPMAAVEEESAPLSIGPETICLRTRTTGCRIAFAVAHRAVPDRETDASRGKGAGAASGDGLELTLEIGRKQRLDRLVVVYTSREVDRPEAAARAHLERVQAQGVDRLVRDHVAAWSERWRGAEIQVDGDADAQRALRFACYHLIAAANPDDDRVSVGARMLTGPAYKGHVFWDTEIYMLPFYIFTHPSAARALLMYRYHTLPAARGKARALGWRGALYAWESADTGEEATPPFAVAPGGEVIPILNGEQENHVNAAVAYAVWQYWSCTGDDEFLLDAGAEILIETARFWESRSEPGDDGRYHIRRVIGPDEYHTGVDDNAYTNHMAQSNLERAAEAARLLAARWPARWRELVDRLAIEAEEPERWNEVASAMYTGFDPETGLYEQFRGYFDLEEVDLSAYEPRTAPMDVLLGHERTQRTQVAKQADVVLMLYLLWDRFPPEVREANFRYYEPRCGHGSSLSPSIHALVAARLGDLELAERYFRQAAEIDLANNMGNAAGGVHAAALGGLWQATVFGFGGVRTGPDGLIADPHLPRRWRALRFPLQWRGRTFRLRATADAGTDLEEER